MAVRSVSGKAGERIVLVDETQANRQTIEAYELITRKLRVPRVPLLFRALAGEKALLPCWQALRPAVRLRAFEEGADELRASAARTVVEMGCSLIETQLEWAGYDIEQIDEIRGQVNVFHYQNPKLLLAMAVLREALVGTAGGGKETPRATQRVPRGVPHEAGIVELVPEDADGSLQISRADGSVMTWPRRMTSSNVSSQARPKSTLWWARPSYTAGDPTCRTTQDGE